MIWELCHYFDSVFPSKTKIVGVRKNKGLCKLLRSPKKYDIIFRGLDQTLQQSFFEILSPVSQELRNFWLKENLSEPWAIPPFRLDQGSSLTHFPQGRPSTSCLLISWINILRVLPSVICYFPNCH